MILFISKCLKVFKYCLHYESNQQLTHLYKYLPEFFFSPSSQPVSLSLFLLSFCIFLLLLSIFLNIFSFCISLSLFPLYPFLLLSLSLSITLSLSLSFIFFFFYLFFFSLLCLFSFLFLHISLSLSLTHTHTHTHTHTQGFLFFPSCLNDHLCTSSFNSPWGFITLFSLSSFLINDFCSAVTPTPLPSEPTLHLYL